MSESDALIYPLSLLKFAYIFFFSCLLQTDNSYSLQSMTDESSVMKIFSRRSFNRSVHAPFGGRICAQQRLAVFVQGKLEYDYYRIFHFAMLITILWQAVQIRSIIRKLNTTP